MTVSSTNAKVSDVPPVPTPLPVDRSQPTEELLSDEDDAKPHSKFQAQGVYKPPHMRTPSEPMASIAGSDPVVSDTVTVCPAHGSSLDHEGNGTSRPHTPHTSFAPGLAAFGFGEVKKIIHEELLNVRKAMEEMETIEKEFLKEEARFERHIQVLKGGGLTDEEIRAIVDWDPAVFPSRPPTVQSLDVNVGICLNSLESGGDSLSVRQSVTTGLACVNLGSEQEVEQPARKGAIQQIEEELGNKTPIPGGPMYSSVNHPRGVHQTGKYGCFGPPTTPANSAHQNTVVHQATSWNEWAYPGVTGHQGSIPTGTFQVPGQIYQTTPRRRFNPTLPPRFRQLASQQSLPLNFQNVVQNRPKDTVPVSHPVSWPPVPSQPLNSIPNHTFRPPVVPPPPRPYFYEVDLVFDFEGIALSSNCNRDVFVKTYWKRNGFSPSQAAWAAWRGAVERVERAQQHENRRARERETRERYGSGSRLPRWASNLLEDLPGDDLGHSSSSDASTKVASSRTSEAGDEWNVVVNVVGSNEKRGVELPRVQKRWKDITDKTWAFGEPPRPDDPEQYMTHVVEKVGWQVHDPRPEGLSLGEL